ncbi:MAG: right-handed parallel beta-helix repeat-containing protein, partial [Mycobacterium sp.]
MTVTSMARVGAVAVALGLSVAGPVAGPAAADTPDSDSSAAPAPRGAEQKTPVRSHRSARTARPASAAAAAKPVTPATATPGVHTTSAPPPAAATGKPGPRPIPQPSRAEKAPQPSAAVTSDASGTDLVAPVASAAPAVVQTAPGPGAVAAASAQATASSTGNTGCSACWGSAAPSFGQTVSIAVNHLFNSAFDWLSAFPANPISDLLGGALVLIRRALFFVPEGVTATQTTTSLTVSVNTGSVAYFRQDGTAVQVSGDPGFWGATQFTLSGTDTVAVSNPGNTGCAGFVFTSGSATGDLTTSGIDSIRFEGTAAFTGSVEATLTAGSLSLRDAVRGQTGVNIDAQVVLGSDVEIDAGTGDARFAGTVDGASSGGQSLTVTALGTTTFAGDVGSIAPLASLLTQGIAPLSVAQSGDSKTIPLHFLPEIGSNPPSAPGSSTDVKYGIDVAVGDNPSQVYEFDTGGTALFAGYNQPFWVNVPLTNTPAGEVYNSGNYYSGVVSNTVVTLGQGQQTVSTAQPIGIGAILAGGNSKTGEVFDFTNPAAPPVQGRFFGDFGASFSVNSGLTSPLVQLPGNLSSGFLVQIGPIGVTPQLTVGVTEELRSQFAYAIPLIPSPKGGTYPTSGLDILDQFGFAPTYSVAQGAQTEVLGTGQPANIACASAKPCLATLIDSGAPTTGVRLGENGVAYFATPDGTQLQPGTTFTATFPTTQGRPALTWEFVAGDNTSVNQVDYQKTQKVDNPENVNVGLTLYNYFDVMFDVANKTIWLRPTGAQSDVVLASVTTTGDQTYRQNAELGGTYTTSKGGTFSVAGITTVNADTAINTGAGAATFSGTIDSAATGARADRPSLTVNSTGATTFVRAVGGQVELGSLTTDAGGTTATAGVTTSGDQTFGDDVSLSGSYSVTDGTFSIGGATTLEGQVGIFGGTILFNGTVDSRSGEGFQLGLTPGDGKTANLNGSIGATSPLGGLRLSAAANGSATFNVNRGVAVQGNLGYSSEKGIDIGQNVSAVFNAGAVVQDFTGAGVIVDGATLLTISGFVISRNGKEGIQVGRGTTGLQLTDNVITGNYGDGISVDGASAVSISGNTITSNGADGVLIKDSTRVAVSGNTLSANGSDGIEARAGHDNSIVSNLISGNSGNGIYLKDGTRVTIVDNDIAGNGTSASNSNVVGNGGTFHANGIYVDGATDVSIVTNTITANGVGSIASAPTTTYANGIHANGATTLTVTGNTITGNGINAANTANLTLFANGIYAAGSTGVSLTGNTISGNGVLTGASGQLTIHAAGVYSDDSSPVQITDNTITANASGGVEVRAGNGNAILSNSISGNRGRGIVLNDNGNDGQPSPEVRTATLTGRDLVVTGTVNPLIGYMDNFKVQIFFSPSTDAPDIQGQELIYTSGDVPAGDFRFTITVPSSVVTVGFV